MVEKKANKIKKAKLMEGKIYSADEIQRMAEQKEKDEIARKQKAHEKILNQDGMDEFLKTVKNAKKVKVSFKKRYEPSAIPLVEKNVGIIVYEFGKYEVHKSLQIGWYRSAIFIDGKPVLRFDEDILKMVEERAKELNPKDVEKCQKEIDEWYGKLHFILATDKTK